VRYGQVHCALLRKYERVFTARIAYCSTPRETSSLFFVNVEFRVRKLFEFRHVCNTERLVENFLFVRLKVHEFLSAVVYSVVGMDFAVTDRRIYKSTRNSLRGPSITRANTVLNGEYSFHRFGSRLTVPAYKNVKLSVRRGPAHTFSSFRATGTNTRHRRGI